MDNASAPLQQPTKSRRLWIWLLGICVFGLLILLLLDHYGAAQSKTAQANAQPNIPMPGVPVVTTAARKGDIGIYVEALGTVTPVYTDSMVSRVQGQVMEIHYAEGQMVHKGDPLVDIDPRPYQAAMTQIEGQLGHDQALLNEAKIDLERYQAAFAKNAIAKQQVDDQQQAVLQDEGTVKNDEGQLDNAQVNLVYCHITSPIDGRVGLRLIDPGNLVQANSTTPLVVVTQLQPITVIFNVAEDYLPQIQAQLGNGQRLEVDAFDRTQEKKIEQGFLLSLDNQIDTATGTLKLRAQFPNTNNALFPNQFVNARLLVQTQHGVTLIPSAAIQRNAQTAFVYTVGPDQKAAMHTVTVGTTDGNTSAVEGVQPGDTVVVGGFDKLQDGVKVALDNNSPSGTVPTSTTGAP
jgi:multidrug efflux system membrane fusion protein